MGRNHFPQFSHVCVAGLRANDPCLSAKARNLGTSCLPKSREDTTDRHCASPGADMAPQKETDSWGRMLNAHRKGNSSSYFDTSPNFRTFSCFPLSLRRPQFTQYSPRKDTCFNTEDHCLISRSTGAIPGRVIFTWVTCSTAVPQPFIYYSLSINNQDAAS